MTARHADAIIEDARAALCEQGEAFTIGCSRGAADVPAEAATLERALHLADERLYVDKRSTKIAESLQVRDALLQLVIEQNAELATHATSVAGLAAATATRLGLPPGEVARTRIAAELHDIGKTAIPASILAKPGPLDEDEWEFVKRHTLIGERIVSVAPALAHIAPIVRSSHERQDGRGYPDGLSADAIPLGARIVAVVDAFDAMITSRPYKPAVSRPRRWPSCTAAPDRSSTPRSSRPSSMCWRTRWSSFREAAPGPRRTSRRPDRFSRPAQHVHVSDPERGVGWLHGPRTRFAPQIGSFHASGAAAVCRCLLDVYVRGSVPVAPVSGPMDVRAARANAGRGADHRLAGREPRAPGRAPGVPRRAVQQARVHGDRQSRHAGADGGLLRACLLPCGRAEARRSGSVSRCSPRRPAT